MVHCLQRRFNMLPILILVLACVQVAVFEEQYVIPDNINVDDILKNERLTKNYINCALGKGKCTPEGEKLKNAIPEALRNECAKCNNEVKENVKKVLRHLIKNHPDLWNELKAKFDPNGEFKDKYKEFLEKEGLKP